MGAKNQFNIKYITRSQRWYRNYLALLGSFLIAFAAASTFAPVHNSGATEFTVENEATGWYITVTSSDTLALNVNSTPLGQLASVKDSVNVKTNSPLGYRLMVSAPSTNLVNTNAASSYFSAVSGTLDNPKSLTRDTWGFSLDEQATPIPDSGSQWAGMSTAPVQIASSDTYNIPNGTDTDIYFAVNASTDLPSGTYSNTITYTAFSEGVNEDLPTMQDFTQAKCDALTTDVATRLVDTRDLKVYNVTKMKDGNCWMTSNLALDGGRTLTPADSDVVTNHELPENISDGTASAYDIPQIYSGIADNTTTSDGGNSHIIVSDVKYGNLYNWNAATATVGKQATTGTVYESICPRGWRLPDNGTTAGTKSWSNLLSAYDYPAENKTNEQDSNTYDYIEAMQVTPFFIPLVGHYNNSAIGQGHYARLWSRTANSSHTNNAYYFRFDTDNGDFYPQYGILKYVAFSIRCVFGENSTNIMQNFTTANCTALTESTTTADNRKVMQDNRDGKLYNISKLKDGNCWMVTNLALDGVDSQGNVRTLTPSDSNVTANHTLTANIPDNTPSADDAVQIFSGAATSIDEYNNPYGNHYNWYAATAGVGKHTDTSAVTQSICPKGWRLPDAGTTSGAKTYANLLSKYGMPTSVVSGTNANQYYIALQQAPLYIVAAGHYEGYFMPDAGINYTSRVPNSSNSNLIVTLRAVTGYYSPNYGTPYKYTLLPLRCVFSE